MEKNKKYLQEILSIIIEIADPLKVVLFGSAARDQMDSHSDYDFLIVVDDKSDSRKITRDIYKNLVGVGFASDILVVNKKELEDYSDLDGLVYKQALEEGKTLYAA